MRDVERFEILSYRTDAIAQGKKVIYDAVVEPLVDCAEIGSAPLTDPAGPNRHFRCSPINGRRQTGPVGPVRAISRRDCM